ncbi:MAG: ABC transporter ATP-binding protein/permease [Gammaproteobacteria bacterium]|nr:ABC transporter ATP-binding protein/permease [Gammaproteobacteria bacterium]MBU1979084.1 ABC transporter ATP-binding protein/permease [Gammaproteobacteria bacterium]
MIDTIDKLMRLFTRKQRRHLIFLMLLMVVAALLELIGIGALVPVVGVMQNPEIIEKSRFLSTLSAFMGNPSREGFFLILLFILLFLFLSKNIFIYVLTSLQFGFVANEMAALSVKLMSGYLRRPYTFHLQINTAQLIRNVTGEVSSMLYQVLIPTLILLSEGMVIIGLFTLIVVMDPLAAFVALSAGSAFVWLFYRTFRERLATIGSDLQVDAARLIQYAQEGLGGIKEIKVLCREAFFEEGFARHARGHSQNVRLSLLLNALPRLVLETLFIALFVGVMLVMTGLGRMAEALPLMAVYAASAFRLLPGLNRIMTSLNQLRLGAASLGTVYSDIENDDFNKSDSSLPAIPGMRDKLEVKSVSYVYPGANKPSIKNISLVIRSGEMVGFVGKSGSGKTTLIDIILGLLSPTSGKVLVDGITIEKNLMSWQRQVGYIPQSIYLTDDTLRRNVALGLLDDEIEDGKIWAALEGAQLKTFVEELADGLDTLVGERGVRLSGGQRQRIGIARALYHDPKILILDEATSALDNQTEGEFIKTVRGLRGNKTILVIAHRLSTIEGCDRVCLLHDGELMSVGSYSEVVVNFEKVGSVDLQ